MARTKRPAVKGRVFTSDKLFGVSNTVVGGKSGGKPHRSGSCLTPTPRQREHWEARLADTKAWVDRKGRFPKRTSAPQYETYLATWLANNLPGRCMYLPERFAKLNDTFGPTWAKKFCPGFGMGGFQTSTFQRKKRNPLGALGQVEGGKGAMLKMRREKEWKKRLAEATEWVRLNGRFPKSNLLNKKELSLYDWLRKNLPKCGSVPSERWELLNKAFWEGWVARFRPGLRLEKPEM